MTEDSRHSRDDGRQEQEGVNRQCQGVPQGATDDYGTEMIQCVQAQRQMARQGQ
jgi:hypothetical protein